MTDIFETMLKGVFALDAFRAKSASFLLSDGTTRTVKGVFEYSYDENQKLGKLHMINSQKPTFVGFTSDLEGVQSGDKMTIDGVVYIVSTIDPDAMELTKLELVSEPETVKTMSDNFGTAKF